MIPTTLNADQMENEIIGWYYLHVNGDVIYKNNPDAIVDIRESDFCVAAWGFNPSRRELAWGMLVELSTHDNPLTKQRVSELSSKWGITDKDAESYALYLNVELGIDGNMKCVKEPYFEDLQKSRAGFGVTYLEALADLCKQMDVKWKGTLWNDTFNDFVRRITPPLERVQS